MRDVDVPVPGGLAGSAKAAAQRQDPADAGLCGRCAMKGEKSEERREMILLRKPVARAVCSAALREGSTGRVVCIAPERVRLQRVWAVAEVEPAGRTSVPPTHDERTVMDGAPEDLLNGSPRESPKVELAFYRKYTEALLRRYLRLSTQTGRVPSLMGRDVFRGNVSHYTVRGFEDVVIFCHDVEQRLAKLNPMEQQLIKRVALQRYTRGETAGMLGIGLNTCTFRYGRAVDRLTGLLMEAGLLDLTRR